MKIIIVGAGAAGLMAAYELIRKGAEVVLLESLDRIGGRIHTLTPEGFSNQIEAGAEFIHGNLPLTLKLMGKANLAYTPTQGEMIDARSGRLQSGFGKSKTWDAFYKSMLDLKKDCTVLELLQAEFSAAKYAKFRTEVYDQAQGLDLADISRLSVFGIREEWTLEGIQYRPDAGYQALLQWLLQESVSEAFQLRLNKTVKSIEWSAKKIKVKTQNGQWTANALLLTLPPNCYAKKNIVFEPQIPTELSLFQNIGFGEVIKILLEFEHPFWEKEHPGLGFLFAEAGFTFWTQLPKRSSVMTAWLGNDYASDYDSLNDTELCQMALKNLQKAMKTDLTNLYKSGVVFRYTHNSHVGGGYSWPTPSSRKAVKTLQKGVKNTIWFAGEALFIGKGTATVEAALQSGKKAASSILSALNK